MFLVHISSLEYNINNMGLLCVFLHINVGFYKTQFHKCIKLNTYVRCNICGKRTHSPPSPLSPSQVLNSREVSKTASNFYPGVLLEQTPFPD